jgi:hypothetical protein
MLNSGGAIIEAGFNQHGEYELLAHNGGKFGVWCAQPPHKVWLDKHSDTYEYQAETHMLYVHPEQSTPTILIQISMGKTVSSKGKFSATNMYPTK